MKKITLGYLPLVDAAPLILAQERGLYAKYGLDVALRRVTSWARMRDLLASGELDGAHMLAPMVVASALGLEPCADFTTALSLNLGGNAITLAKPLYESLQQYSGPTTASRLKALIHERKAQGDAPLNFASVYPFSSHSYQLRHWLETGGIDPDRDVRIVVVSPPRLPDHLQRGEVAGYCVGEPWNLVAQQEKTGVTIITARSLLGRAPEKVLAVRRDWSDVNNETHEKLVRAVFESCRQLDSVDTRLESAGLLQDRGVLNLDVTLLRMALTGDGRLLADGSDGSDSDFIRFYRDDANRPALNDALGFARQMRKWGQVSDAVDLERACRRAYQTEAFETFTASL